jgi:hypothetical protein
MGECRGCVWENVASTLFLHPIRHLLYPDFRRGPQTAGDALTPDGEKSQHATSVDAACLDPGAHAPGLGFSYNSRERRAMPPAIHLPNRIQ